MWCIRYVSKITLYIGFRYFIWFTMVTQKTIKIYWCQHRTQHRYLMISDSVLWTMDYGLWNDNNTFLVFWLLFPQTVSCSNYWNENCSICGINRPNCNCCNSDCIIMLLAILSKDNLSMYWYAVSFVFREAQIKMITKHMRIVAIHYTLYRQTNGDRLFGRRILGIPGILCTCYFGIFGLDPNITNLINIQQTGCT